MSNQRGFALIYMLLGVMSVIIIIGGTYYLGTLKNTKPEQTSFTKKQPIPKLHKLVQLLLQMVRKLVHWQVSLLMIKFLLRFPMAGLKKS